MSHLPNYKELNTQAILEKLQNNKLKLQISKNNGLSPILIHRFTIPSYCDFEDKIISNEFYENYLDQRTIQQKINEVFGNNFTFDLVPYATMFGDCLDDYGNDMFCCTPIRINLVKNNNL